MSAIPERFRKLPVVEFDNGLVAVRATSYASRLRGLLGLPDLPATVGLYLAPGNSIHTLRMRFAIDLLWLDKKGLIVRIDRGVRRNRLKYCQHARSVLEVRAGEADQFAELEFKRTCSVTEQ